jgi:SAM-dependent methyltransferase
VAERLEERLSRLARERQDADQQYNDALTDLDRALPSRPEVPAPPPPYDASKLPDVNLAHDILAAGPPKIDGSLKGRLRGFIWRVVGPPLEAQRHFNASLVDHLNRNAAAHQQAQETTRRLVALLSDHLGRQIEFQARLLRLLQTVTLYVDTRDRSVAGGQDVLNAGLSAVTDTWMKRWESLALREERFVQRLASGLASVEDLRQTASLAQLSALALKRDVERLLSATPVRTGAANEPTLQPEGAAGERSESGSAASGPPDLEAFKYLGFEDRFRGAPEAIRSRLAEYAPLFDGLSEVLDVGCGRGEFLDLLRARGTSARGLDLNQAMVAASRERGLNVVNADALTYLDGLPDASLGGIFAAQVVEHLAPDYLMRLVETAAHKIRPGGRIVLETINPACWLAFFESYIRDLTHVRPLHPETLQYLVRVSGFHGVALEFKSPVPDVDRLHPLPEPTDPPDPAVADFVETFNENVAKLNGRLFTFQDYAVVGDR